MSGIHVRILLNHARIAAGRDQRLLGVVRLTAERHESSSRAPVDLVACIDASGSMSGRKLAEASSSVTRLVRELDSDDRLALVAFSSRAVRYADLRPMDAAGRERLRAAVGRLHPVANTNMSGGLLESFAALRETRAATRETPTLRRVLLFTDGHANEGIAESDRAGWSSLLREQLGDASVSLFGYGEDHDAEFLSWLADQTRGNSYVARDADAIADAFAKELGGLLGTVAQQVRIRLRAPGGLPVLLNDERVDADGAGICVELADLSSEERRDLVFELPVAAGTLGQRAKAVEAEVSWVDARTGRRDSVVVSAHVDFVEEGRVDAPDLEVREAFVLEHAAGAMRQATVLAERHEFPKAESLLVEAALLAQEVPTARAGELAAMLRGLARKYGEALVYSSSRSRLAGIRRSMSKQRSSGSEADEFFTTGTQRRMQEKFSAGDDE